MDESCEDFPWPYLITPRLPGLCLQNPAEREGLTRRDFLSVAEAMGRSLVDLQALTWDSAGDFDPDVQALAPYPGGYAGHLAREVSNHAGTTRRNGALTSDDDRWLEAIMQADAAVTHSATAVYAHNDYHLGNVLLDRAPDGWRVSGVVDLMTSCFGDPAADLVRQSCGWMDVAPECAVAFLTAYRAAGGVAAPSRARLAALALYERLMIWGYFTQPQVADPRFHGLTFRGWAEPYLRRLAKLWFES